MTSQPTTPVPDYYAQRFTKAFAAFVARVREAVEAGILDPAYSSAPAFLMWQTEALPRLQQELQEIEDAYTRFQSGDAAILAQLARDQLGLAGHLDGFPLDFAGPAHAADLDRLETAVVLAAYQLCAVAGTV